MTCVRIKVRTVTDSGNAVNGTLTSTVDQLLHDIRLVHVIVESYHKKLIFLHITILSRLLEDHTPVHEN